MAEVRIADLTKDIRIALDENMSSAQLEGLGDIDTLSHDEIIDSKIEDAALAVVMAAPVEKLGDITESYSDTLSVSSDTGRPIATLPLPANFGRLVSARLGSWKRPVRNALPPTSPLYSQAMSGFNVYGTKERPAAFLVPSASGMSLELPCANQNGETLTECMYVKRPERYAYGVAVYGSVEEECITCREAADIGGRLGNNQSTQESYSVLGYITDNSSLLIQMGDTADGDNVFQIIHPVLPSGVVSLSVGDRIVVTGRIERDPDDGVLIDGGSVVKLSASDKVSTIYRIVLGAQLYRPTVYYAAYLTALVIKDADAAAALLAIAKEQLGIES